MENEIDKRKLSKFWRGVFEEYENDTFPLALLGKNGMMCFKDKQELFDYYLSLTNIDRRQK